MAVFSLAGCYGDNRQSDSSYPDWVVDEPALGDDADLPPIYANDGADDPHWIARPQVILHGNTRAEEFRVANGRLAWIEYDKATLLKMARPHGVQSWVYGKLDERPAAYVITENDVFWTSPPAGKILRLSLAGGPTEVLREAGAPLALAATLDKQLVFGDEDGCVRSISMGGGDATLLACGAEEQVLWLAVDGGRVHWATDLGNLYRVDLAGGDAELRASGEYFDSELVVDAERVYWTNASERVIRSIAHGATTVEDVARGQYRPSNLTQDRWYLYYASDSENAIKRVLKDGGLPPVTLADGVRRAGDVSILGDYLYWMDQDGGDVYTMLLP